MRSIRLMSLVAVIGLIAATLPLTVTASPSEAPGTQANLLKNPSFEEGFTGGVANQWAKWTISDANATPQNNCGRKEPTFQQMTSATDPKRVKDGSNSQQILTPVQDPGFGFYGGLQQTISGLTAGKTYRFSVFAHAWSSTKDNPAISEGTGPAYFEVGIGQGSTYAADPGIKRSGIKDIKDGYQQLTIDAVATGNTITVFTYANPSACSKHNEAFFDAASLTEVGAAPANTSAPGATQPPAAQPTATLRTIPTKFPTPTPNAQGNIVYTVQAGNTIIDICGVIGRGTDPSCIDDIVKWNNLSSPRAIVPGQQLIISEPSGQPAPTATTAPAATADPNTQPTTDPNAQPTTDPNAQPTADPNAQPTTDPNAEPTRIVQPTATEAGAAAICIMLYNDANGNGIYDAGEGLVANGQFSLLDMSNSNTVATYTTDGASEPHCFENLPSGNYRINSTVPTAYKATTRSDWDLTLAAGSTADLQFGAQSSGTATAGETPTTTTADSDSTSRLVRALLAAAGVVLLLIAAGVAGFLVLTRRR